MFSHWLEDRDPEDYDGVGVGYRLLFPWEHIRATDEYYGPTGWTPFDERTEWMGRRAVEWEYNGPRRRLPSSRLGIFLARAWQVACQTWRM